MTILHIIIMIDGHGRDDLLNRRILQILLCSLGHVILLMCLWRGHEDDVLLLIVRQLAALCTSRQKRFRQGNHRRGTKTNFLRSEVSWSCPSSLQLVDDPVAWCIVGCDLLDQLRHGNLPEVLLGHIMWFLVHR